MALTTPPTAPSTGDPSTFAARADALVAWHATNVSELGALQTDVASKQTLAAQSVVDAAAQVALATTQKDLATTQAGNSAASATLSQAAALSAGAIVWVSGTTYAVGDLRYSPIDFQTYRRKTAGAGTDDPSSVAGAAVWLKALAPSLKTSSRTANTALELADQGTLIDITSGTFAQTFSAAATLGNGWWCYIRNSGTGDITLDPNASELIDGLTSFVMYPGEVRLVQCDGAALKSLVSRSFYKTFTATGTFIKPPGYSLFPGLLWGGGGSGASGPLTYGFGGGGSSCMNFTVLASSLSASEPVTIGAGGTSVTAANGNAGGISSFATRFTMSGGGGGTEGTGGSGGATSSTSAGDFLTGLNSGTPGSNGSTGTVTTTIYGAGGGGSGANVDHPGHASTFGGHGGATIAFTANSATAGTAPGGGGAGQRFNTVASPSGAGARGELRIWGVI